MTLIQIIDHHSDDDYYVNINFYIIFVTYRCKLLLILMLRGENLYRGKTKGSAITVAHCHHRCYLNRYNSLGDALQTQKKHRIFLGDIINY